MAKPAHTIRFTHTWPQQNFKLLELPLELVELLSSDQAPMYVIPFLLFSVGCCLKIGYVTIIHPSPFFLPPPMQICAGVNISSSSLHLKSPPSPLSGPTNRDYVNLCTSTQTYSLRQVQSSNSIFLIKPLPSVGDRRKGPEGHRDTTVREDDAVLAVTDTVTAIAQCNATLELQKLDAAGSAIAFLQQSLRVYDSLRIEADELGLDAGIADGGRVGTDIEAQRAKARAFTDVPLSAAECERGWVEMCGFVHEDHVSGSLMCWRPSASVKLEVWRKVVEGSVLQGINLGEQFLIRDLWKAAVDRDGDASQTNGRDPFPRGLFDAVVRRLTFESSSGTSRQDYPFPECKFILVLIYILSRIT